MLGYVQYNQSTKYINLSPAHEPGTKEGAPLHGELHLLLAGAVGTACGSDSGRPKQGFSSSKEIHWMNK